MSEPTDLPEPLDLRKILRTPLDEEAALLADRDYRRGYDHGVSATIDAFREAGDEDVCLWYNGPIRRWRYSWKYHPSQPPAFKSGV